jgi:hypothetical protein
MTRPATATITLRIANPGNHSGAEVTVSRVSLPAPPWGGIEPDDRSATAPRSAPVRGPRTWRRDPVLRSADARRDRG